jgi:isoleucyl-tRNA synthetase
MVQWSSHGLVREQSKPIRWSYRLKHSISDHEAAVLEEEIVQLRKSMEQAFLDNQSLTSDHVVGISRLLDEKINEYMRKSYQ